ncbi:MAG: TRAP transporter substrate-binding protein [Geminicoccaceae bacterium]|nr:MAG: TRAP transporter substrate-binding protein [Geminicoccaceae bacterium]
MPLAWSRRAVGGVAVFAALGFLTATGTAQAEWRGWNIHVPEYSVSQGMDWFTDELAARTDGRLTARTFHSGVLGSQPDAIEQLRLGGIDFAVFNLGPMGPVVPETNVVSLPFVFRDLEHSHRAMDGALGEALAEAMAREGLKALAWYDSGSRSFYNSQRPINTPADLRGMKVRVMNNDLFVGMIEALGGNATPMAFSEVYQSLRTGVVDGAENNFPSFQSTGHFEVAGYYSISEHLIIPECLCMNLRRWNSLSAEDQALVLELAQASAVMQRELWAESDAAAMEAVIAAGVRINEVEDKAAFQAAMSPVYEMAFQRNPELEPLVELIQSIE